MIYHISNPNVPHLRFEWHEETQRVYLVQNKVGDPIAFDVQTHGDAINVVLVWSRGYRRARTEIALMGTI